MNRCRRDWVQLYSGEHTFDELFGCADISDDEFVFGSIDHDVLRFDVSV